MNVRQRQDLMPYIALSTHNIVDIQTKFIFVKRTMMEIWSDVTCVHEMVARAWLKSKDGGGLVEKKDTARNLADMFQR